MKNSKSTPVPIQKGKLSNSDSTLNTSLTSLNANNKRIIDNYQLGEILGKGAMGIVYKALDLNDGSTVALKRIPEGKNTDSITKEIDLMKGFSHSKIIGYLGYVQTSNHLNLILEYVENGSLENLLRKFGPLSEQLSALYMYQVLEGLIYLHGKGVVHRDIKAGNILLTKTGEIKLTDFGISTSSGLELNQQKPTFSLNAESIGSPFWMAPEIIQMREGAEIEVQSDIWSVGCTILELLTGYPPFWDLGALPAMFAMVENDHPPIPMGLTRDCEEFLLKCFMKEPSQRPTATQLKNLPWIANKTNNQTVDGKMLSSTLLKQTEHKLISRRVPSAELSKEDIEGAISPVRTKSRSSTIVDKPLSVSFEEKPRNAAPRKVTSEDFGNGQQKKDKAKEPKVRASHSTSTDSGFSKHEDGNKGNAKAKSRKSVRVSSSAPEVIASEFDFNPLPHSSERSLTKSGSSEGRRLLKESSGSSVKTSDELAYLEMADRLNQEKVLSIQNSFSTGKELRIATSSRRYVRDGPLTKVCRRTRKKRWFFLFNDIIIYAKVLNPKSISKRDSINISNDGESSYESPISNSKMKFQFHRKLELSETRVDPILSELPQMRFAFVIKNSGKSFIVLAENEAERENWIRDISRCVDKCTINLDVSVGRNRSPSTVARENFLSGVPGKGGIAASIMEINAESDSIGEVFVAPIWVHDSASDRCMSCQKSFGLITRKHHCRACGILVCSSCSGQKTFLPNVDPNERVRVCTKCLSKIHLRRLTIGDSNSSSQTTSRSSSNAPLPSPDILSP